jgi:hypothetical protein
MPTSQELQSRKEQAHFDSLLQAEYFRQEMAQQQLWEDSFFDPMIQSEEISAPSSPPTVHSPVFTNSGIDAHFNRFHIIVGSFKVLENAERMIRRLTERGYHPVELSIKSGFIVISADSFSERSDAVAAMRRMQDVDRTLCPYDAYIYDANQRPPVENSLRW